MVAQTLENHGFSLKLFQGSNPVYSIKYAENKHPIVVFKTYDDALIRKVNLP
jgi:arsenate reductase